MHKAVRLYSLHNLQIFLPGMFILVCAIFCVGKVKVGICLGNLKLYHVHWRQCAWAHPAEVCVLLFLSFLTSCSIYLHCCLTEIKSTFLRKRRHTLDTLFLFVYVCRGLESCTSILENVSLRVSTRSIRDFSKFGVCRSNRHCPSARCAYAANVVGIDCYFIIIIITQTL
jgi:hypothetical protein